MRTRVLLAAAAFVVVGIVTGCDRTVPGTVAMTTEPGASIRTTVRPTVPRTTPRTPRTTSVDPPPSDVENITCREYATLDPDAQTSVIDEILSGAPTVLGPGDAEVAKSLVDAVCTFLPDSPVSQILTGGG